MMVWLVTGATGFLGRHLLDALEGGRPPGVEVRVLGRRCPARWPAERFVLGDLTHPRSVRAALRGVEPEVVFHLAGRTPPAAAGELYQANTLATALLLDALGERGGVV